MHTALTRMFGLAAPIISAPFGPWDSVDVAAAVGNAGGLGSVGTAVRPVADLRRQWARLRGLTDSPFAINHQPRPFDPVAFDATLAAAPAVISYHMGDPGDLVARAHDCGIRWMQQVMDLDQAEQALERNVDQGGEAGGHSGFVSTLVLVPQVVAIAGERPVIAAGGMADGRGLAAALALGASGIVMGTRFLASTEMTINQAWKNILLGAESRDAHHSPVVDAVLPPYNRPHHPAAARALPTSFERDWHTRLPELRARAADIGRDIVADVLAGGGEQYVPFAGQSVGLIHDIRPAADIVRDTVMEAEHIIRALADRVGLPPPDRSNRSSALSTPVGP
jgi:enoyl-[acyl-carrier protein] reductase II